MRSLFRDTLLATGLAACTLAAHAATPPAGAPAGTTALCKDGTYSSAAKRKGACADHRGTKKWYGAAAAPAMAEPAVQTQSAQVQATGQAPTTGLPSRTPATPAAPGR